MGNRLASIQGYGTTEIAAFEAMRLCFIYQNGEKEWEWVYMTKVDMDKEFELSSSKFEPMVDFYGLKYKRFKYKFISHDSRLYSIGLKKGNGLWKCFIIE